MSDFENDLVRLGGAIADAKDSLEQALRLAMQVIGDVPEEARHLPGWQALETLADRLDAIVKQLAELPGPEIAKAIEEANAYLDEMSDRADGLSY